MAFVVENCASSGKKGVSSCCSALVVAVCGSMIVSLKVLGILQSAPVLYKAAED